MIGRELAGRAKLGERPSATCSIDSRGRGCSRARQARASSTLSGTYGTLPGAHAKLERWRVIFLACAELFGYRDGREWLVANYRFRPHHG